MIGMQRAAAVGAHFRCRGRLIVAEPIFAQAVGGDFAEIAILEFVADRFGNARMAARAILREHDAAALHRAIAKLRFQIRLTRLSYA